MKHALYFFFQQNFEELYNDILASVGYQCNESMGRIGRTSGLDTSLRCLARGSEVVDTVSIVNVLAYCIISKTKTIHCFSQLPVQLINESYFQDSIYGSRWISLFFANSFLHCFVQNENGQDRYQESFYICSLFTSLLFICLCRRLFLETGIKITDRDCQRGLTSDIRILEINI